MTIQQMKALEQIETALKMNDDLYVGLLMGEISPRKALIEYERQVAYETIQALRNAQEAIKEVLQDDGRS